MFLVGGAARAAPTVVDNIHGYTLAGGVLHTFTALAFDDGKVLQTGSAAALRARFPNATVIDGHGDTLLPGLIDAHGHMLDLGFDTTQIQLAGTRNLAQAQDAIRAYAQSHGQAAWLLGDGWNQVTWQLGRFPSAGELDAAVADKPVVLSRVDGHAVWLNTRALQMAGIVRETPDPPGGRIERDTAGNPSGVLVDEAMALVEKVVPQPTDEERRDAMVAALRVVNAAGLTSVGDAGDTARDIALYRTLAEQGQLTARVYAMIRDTGPDFAALAKGGPVIGAYGDCLNVRAVKLFADGALGSRGAALLAPYSDSRAQRGLLFMTDAEMRDKVRTALAAGFQVNVHAIGDAANRQVLDAFAAAYVALPGARALRNRIEHAQIVSTADIPRFKALDLIASMQPTHATSDMNMAEDRIGAARLRGAYAWRTFLDQGTHIAGGSDFPVESPNPFFGIYAAVTRTDHDGLPAGGWHAEQKMTLLEAFRAFTLDAAYAQHQERLIGSLEPGKYADFILVDRDIFKIAPSEIWKTVVHQTYLAGQRVYAEEAAAPDLLTTADLTHDTRTGRYDEVIRLCKAYEAHWPRMARCFDFGTTPEGRPMLGLALSADGALTPEVAHARDRPVVLVQGGIHAGEIDGKDAGFRLARELLTQAASKSEPAGAGGPAATAASPLNKVTFVFVPVFNVDGHERFGRWNRPNQRGPEEMGWRTTAQNINLNRDYMKADAPEMQAMLSLLNAWDPIVYVDAHVTDGAQFQNDFSITDNSGGLWDREVQSDADALLTNILERSREQGFLAVDYYPSLERDDDPASGFSKGPSTARYSHSYWTLSNRMAFLLETHSWKDYARRVRMTHDVFAELLALAARDGARWQGAAHAADARAALLAGTAVPLAFDNVPPARTIDFPGYAYERHISPISGELVTHYDETKPQMWRIPLLDQVTTTLAVSAPREGYVVPAAYAEVIGARLRLHGVRFETLAVAEPGATLQTWRATKVGVAPKTYEGRTRFTLEGAWVPERRDIAAGSLFVPIAQPKARLVMELLEPQAPDSFAAWGMFATAFEQKEYMEPYVVEHVATDMLAQDPKLAAEFRRALQTDPAFAKDPDARREFFYRRHPSWDERYRMYPVYRK